jgi:hypothetical protein
MTDTPQLSLLSDAPEVEAVTEAVDLIARTAGRLEEMGTSTLSKRRPRRTSGSTTQGTGRQ